MRIHFQNPTAAGEFDLTLAQWREVGGPEAALSFGRTKAEFDAAMAEAEILITSTGVLKALLPMSAPKLRIVYVVAAGVEKLAPFDWLPAGAQLINNSGTHGPKVVEYGAMALIMLGTRMPEMIANQRAEKWESIFTPTLAGRHAVVVGTGDLGAAIARAARFLGMRTTGVRRVAEAHADFDAVVASADLDRVLPGADFLALACPLTAETAGMMSRARLQALPKGAGLINVGRGALIDQEAMCDLLEAGHLGGAVIDVVYPEPPPAGDRVWHTRNLIITPHCSADSPLTYNTDSLRIFLENLRVIEAGGVAPNRVDIARGY